MNNTIKKAVIYCRVSTTKQENNWDSLNNQEKACRTYCKNNKIQVLWVFKEAFTWKTTSRPIFNEAINNAKKNNVNYFVVFDIDRFSREWYWKYSDLKEDLYDSKIELRDCKNIIQGSSLAIKNDVVDMSQYKWNRENSSQYTEVMIATQAQIEWKKIIQRTIPREIELEQLWYQVRASNYWYENKKDGTIHWRVSIQVKHPIEWDFLIEMFEERAKWHLSDKEIVESLILKWCTKRSWKAMDVKYMQELIKKPVYAWIISTKWTWNKPIRTAYKWLIDINTWNKANRWKLKIIEIDDKEVKIEYDNWKQKQINKPITERRKNYNPDYCYSKVLKCPECWGYLTGSASRSRDGTLHNYYNCRWKGWVKHSTYSIKQSEAHNTITSTMKELKIQNSAFEVYKIASRKLFKERQLELEKNTKTYWQQITELNKQEQKIISDIDKVIDYPSLLDAKNKELENIKSLKYKLELKKNEKHSSSSLDKFLYYSKEVITHIDKLAIQKEEPELINLTFDIIYDWKIEYENMKSHTQDFSSFFSLQSQQKNLQNGDFPSNLKWQSYEKNSHTQEYNNIEAFVKRMIVIMDRYKFIVERINFNRL